MMFLRILTIVLMIFGLTACAEIVSNVLHSERQKTEKPPSIFDSGLETMGFYGRYVIQLSQAERVYECRKLNNAHAVDPNSIGVRLHLAYVTSLTPECGGSQKAMELLDAAQNQTKNPALAGSLQYQLQLLQQINTQLERNSKLQDQVSTLEKQNESLKNKLKLKDAELEELEKLRAKLDALKSIEKTFHQRNGSGRK